MNSTAHLTTYAAVCAFALASTVFAADATDASAEARQNAKLDYDSALVKCKQMQGAERSSCRKQAREARDQALRAAGPAASRVSPDLIGGAIPPFAGNPVR
jgi:hypothetical protein